MDDFLNFERLYQYTTVLLLPALLNSSKERKCKGKCHVLIMFSEPVLLHNAL